MSQQIYHKTIAVDGVDIFYREAGDSENPSLLLLHGFPSSSVMFNDLMIALADRYHLIAPDYPGFGFSAFPAKDQFEYTFQNIALHIGNFVEAVGLKFFAIYLHDYGCPIGLRICLRHPEKIAGIIIQNGNAYIEGIGAEWDETRDYWENPTEEKKNVCLLF
ncbi:alpha/beta fold hydrolase [Pseudochryseolinea flava]|uniref:alpha/beta fold hydrolase n=1 Tax=Pseudochryseolinea flava TaxID=2059302 RepID=UPI001C86927F|nr:alpha/beta fold hydrolase [Pseudochryseolinea flava]